MSDEFGLLQLCRAKPRSVRICAEADRVIRTHDQAIGTFDQKTRLGLALVPSRQLKSGELKAGRSIKKYERAIIPRKAKTRQNSASTRVADVNKEIRRSSRIEAIVFVVR
jgi:hypothetical protein